MRPSNFEKRIAKLIEPCLEGFGVTLWGIHAPAVGKKTVIGIFIDAEGGVNLDTCAEVSKQVAIILDVEDFMSGAYTLEVSSPGLERRFFTTGQMKPYVNREISIELFEGLDGRKKFKGPLSSVSDDSVDVEIDGESINIEWDRVKKARLVHKFK